MRQEQAPVLPEKKKRGLRERKSLATWRRIHNAAFELFAERGYENVNVEAIAESAEVARTTFFNYFASKEAVVFDPDPEERQIWQSDMQARSAGEALWTSLEHVLLGQSDRYAGRMLLQKQLTLTSRSLSKASGRTSHHFAEDLREWVSTDAPQDQLLFRLLALDCALAAWMTAYNEWHPEDGVPRYREMVVFCLREAGKGFVR